MALHNLPVFKIDKENPENGIKDLIRIVKPSWTLDNINIQSLSGGYSSRIYRCFGNDNEDKITVRIRNAQENHQEWQTDIETKAIEHLSTVGHFPTVHAVFANGYCYQYIQGKSVIDIAKKTGIITEEIMRAIAKEMVFIHSVQLPNTEYKEYSFCQKMKTMILKLPHETKYETAPSKESLLKEFDGIEKLIASLNMPLTLIHGDSHPGNYVWNDLQKNITFVDWEVANTGYRFNDVAYLIAFLVMIDPSIAPAMKVQRPENFENMFLKFYFDEWCEMRDEKWNEKAFDEFVTNVKKFKLFPFLNFITIAIYFPTAFDDFAGQGNRMFEVAVEYYLKLKKEILGSDKFED